MQIIQPGQARTRHTRKPVFPVAGTMKPFGLYPMMVTPVLPGETMSGFEAKLRHLSMPVRSPFAGAWLEMWVVYVKLTDISHALAEMFISTDMPTTGYTADVDNQLLFQRPGSIKWVDMCTTKFHESYFLDDGEIRREVETGIPMIRASNINWTQNLMFKPDDLTVSDLPSNPDGQLTGLDLNALMSMSEISYEKYLQQYGVSPAVTTKMEHKPEILRYLRSWVTPTNTIDPTTGAPSSCWAWSQTATAEKPRRFDEPGFLCVFHSIRPKMAAGFLSRPYLNTLWGFADFFPAYNLTDPAAGVVGGSSDFEPFYGSKLLEGTSKDIIWDHRDLLNHGEPFYNSWSYDTARKKVVGTNDYRTPRMGPYPVPSIERKVLNASSPEQDLRHEYPSLIDINSLFKEQEIASPNEARRTCIYEGLCEITIQGHLKDTTL